MRLDFAYCCDCNRLVMDMCGFWPKYRSNFLQKYWFLISASVILMAIIMPRFAAMYLLWNEMDAVVQCFSTQIAFITMVFKLLVMHNRNTALVDLLATMEEDCLKELSTIQYTAVLRTAKIGRIISLFLILSGHCTAIAGVIAMKLYHLDSLYIKNPDSRLSLDLLFASYFPFSTKAIIPYVLVLSLQFLAAAMTSFYFIFDGFVVMLILHICGQLELIQISLRNLKKSPTLTEGKNLQMTLGNILKQHQRVIRFVNNIEESFSWMWFLELATCSLTLCFLGYTVQKLMETDQTSIFQLSFPICAVLSVLMKFFLNCWAGEYLISQSSEIGYAFYETEWYELSPAHARLLMMFGHKKTRPITLTTAKFSSLSFRLFLQVIYNIIRSEGFTLRPLHFLFHVHNRHPMISPPLFLPYLRDPSSHVCDSTRLTELPPPPSTFRNCPLKWQTHYYCNNVGKKSINSALSLSLQTYALKVLSESNSKGRFFVLDLAYCCDCNRLVMDTCGFWPKYRSNFLQKYWFLISASVILMAIIMPRFAAMYLLWNEMDAVVQCFSTQIVFITMVFKLLVMHNRNAALVDLLATMEEDCLEELSTIQYTAVLRTAKIGKIISLFLILSGFCNVIAGAIAMKLYHLDSLYIKNPDPRLSLDLFFASYFPFSTKAIIPYVLVLSLQFLAAAMTSFYFIFDGFVVMLILHICGQLELIQISLRNLKKSSTLTEGKNLQMTLGNIMKQHQRAIRFVHNIEESFSWTWFLELATCSLTLCFLGYTVQKLMETDQTSIFQLSFPICAVLSVLMKFFLNCWAGEYLISQSSEIGYAFYESKWYKLSPTDARLLMMFGHKKIRPITLTAAKFSILSFGLFTQVAYITMLLMYIEGFSQLFIDAVSSDGSTRPIAELMSHKKVPCTQPSSTKITFNYSLLWLSTAIPDNNKIVHKLPSQITNPLLLQQCREEIDKQRTVDQSSNKRAQMRLVILSIDNSADELSVFLGSLTTEHLWQSVQIDATVQCFSTHVPLIIGMVKLIILYFQQQVLGEFLNDMEIDWKNVKPKLHYDTMTKMANIARRISIISGSMIYSANSFGVIVQKFYNLESFYLKNPDPRLTTNLFWIVYLPFGTETSINFWIALLLQFYTSFAGSLCYFAFESLIVMMIFHLCGQLDLVALSLSQFGGDGEIHQIQDIRVKLRSIVKRHEKLIQSARNLETAFNFSLLLVTVGCVLTFCFQGYAVIRLLAAGQLNLFQIGFAVTITFSAVAHFYFCCWAAECLIRTSSAVGDALYYSSWYKLRHSAARYLLLIGFKKFRPLEITSGKFAPLSLDLFLNVIKLSLSYISMLLAVQSRRTC
ncbi:uncharacterized protein LOC135162634 [Diachasmimorpha longicaudata]|uniref:uncharacterized protein LOC135162634 n=1 Tax=Diachasmimorpha longicaudata TaxID=58733 RepID=UPI0030B8E0AD